MTAGSGVICTWDADTCELLQTLEATTKDPVAANCWGDNVVWSASGDRMLVGTDICDGATGAVFHRLASVAWPVRRRDETVSWEAIY